MADPILTDVPEWDDPRVILQELNRQLGSGFFLWNEGLQIRTLYAMAYMILVYWTEADGFRLWVPYHMNSASRGWLSVSAFELRRAGARSLAELLGVLEGSHRFDAAAAELVQRIFEHRSLI